LSVRSEGWIAFWMLFVVTLVGTFLMMALDSEGAVDHETIGTTTDPLNADPPQKYFERSVNGTWYYLYTVTALGLYLAKSTDNGTTWNSEEIVDGSWKGHTAIYPVGVHSTYNNTTIVVFKTLDADLLYNIYLGYNYSGGWLIHNIFGSGSDNPDTITSDTNYSHVCILYRYSTDLRYSVWDWINETQNVDDIQLVAGPVYSPRLTVNVTGDFWVHYTYHDGTYWDFEIRNLDNSENFLQDNVFNLGFPQCGGFEALPNNYFVWFYGWTRFGTSYMYYNKAYWDGTGQSKQNVVSSTDASTNSWFGMTITTGNKVYLWVNDQTNDELYYMTAAYDAIAATFQSSKTVIFDALGATDQVSVQTSCSLFPRDPDGNYTVVPTSGFCIPWLWQEELGDTDNWHFRLSWECEFPVYTIPTAPPEITTVGLDEGTYDELYSFGMSKSGGTAPFQWSIVSGPGWLEIGLTTGILSGTPPGVGTFVVKIQLTDAILRTDTESFNLKINPAETPYTPPTEETISFENLHIGDLWIVLACVSIVVGLSRIITRGARI